MESSPVLRVSMADLGISGAKILNDGEEGKYKVDFGVNGIWELEEKKNGPQINTDEPHMAGPATRRT
jgi:hypothetical protein